MHLLILGGTMFVGRHLVEAALARGHQITLFNRGQHNPDLFPEVEKLRGDRDGDLGALHGRRWDAVIDTCGYVPRIVRASVELLADSVDHYTFISSISVFADMSLIGMDEESPLATMPDASVEEITGETYGPLKVLCEQAAEAAMPGRVLNVRPGLIVGPHDPTDRFTYWPCRVAGGGEVLAPQPVDAALQCIDGRDLAGWIIRMIEEQQVGVYNATGPDYALTMGQLLESCREVSQSKCTFTWIDAQFLLDNEVRPWQDLPFWIPGDTHAGMQRINVNKAVTAGLTFRPLAETIEDTINWAATRPDDHEWRAGIKPEREAELLQAWQEQSYGS